jgi:hypothetical protein
MHIHIEKRTAMWSVVELNLNFLWSKFSLGVIISVCENVRVYHLVFLVSVFSILHIFLYFRNNLSKHLCLNSDGIFSGMCKYSYHVTFVIKTLCYTTENCIPLMFNPLCAEFLGLRAASSTGTNRVGFMILRDDRNRTSFWNLCSFNVNWND